MLILIRHGRTDDVEAGRVRGGDHPGPGLTAAGRAEVEQLAARLVAEFGIGPSGSRLGALVSSPAVRARQTAGLLAEALGLAAQVEPDWREVSLGDWDGLGYRQIASGWPGEFAAWRADPGYAPPNGESLHEVSRRAGAARDRLIGAYPGRGVLVVSHTAPIRTVIATALQAGPAALWRLRLDPAAVSVLRCWQDGGCEVAAVNSSSAGQAATGRFSNSRSSSTSGSG